MCGEGVSVQYVIVDFGAEAVVEAIVTAASDNDSYLLSYYVEYARSDMLFSDFIDQNSNTMVCFDCSNSIYILAMFLRK